jgi:hypothetical protein
MRRRFEDRRRPDRCGLVAPRNDGVTAAFYHRDDPKAASRTWPVGKWERGDEKWGVLLTGCGGALLGALLGFVAGVALFLLGVSKEHGMDALVLPLANGAWGMLLGATAGLILGVIRTRR